VSGADTTTSDGTTTAPTTSSEPSTTDVSATAVDVTTAPPETTSPPDTTTSVDQSSSSGEPFECGCPGPTPIGLDDKLPDGETAAELLAHFAELTLPLKWFAYGDALTTVHFAVEYRGGTLMLGPGGEDGCLFLSAPCGDGVQMEVVVVATTDDGWLSLEVPGELRGYGTDSDVYVDDVPIGDNAGTLAMQPLQVGDDAMQIESLRFYIERTEMREPGFRGLISGSVSAARCGGRCEQDDECGPRQTCIGSVCIGGPCNADEPLAEF
jgi:hypothetical protein